MSKNNKKTTTTTKNKNNKNNDEKLSFFSKIGLEGKENLCKEVVTFAFNEFEDCFHIAKYIQERFKEDFKRDSWIVFVFKNDLGSGFSDYKNTFIGIDYEGYKVSILNS